MVGIEANYIDINSFSVIGNLTDIFIPGRNIKADCGEDGFKFGGILSTSYGDNLTTVNLTPNSDDLTNDLIQIWYEVSPHMEDGRPIVRADTRPLDTQTYFTCRGDDSTAGIGLGKALRWDWSDDDDLYEGDDVPFGFKCKQIDISFICPLYPKDGAIYFFDCPWGCFVEMWIVAPAGSYYPNPAGGIPASALGLPGKDMYAYASDDTPVSKYINNHFLYGSCPMGDELNAEGCSVDPIPPGWILRGRIYTLTSDNTSKGFASFETYRCHSVLLPGQTIDSIH